MFRSVLKEPLVHFLLLSFVLFVLYALLNPGSEDDRVIVITDGRVDQLEASFTKAWSRKPLDKELKNAIDSYAINEMYLREAHALGLDQNDSVIDRRLRQKMDYLLDDRVAAEAPSEEQLNDYYQLYKERYQGPAFYSFEQVFFSDATKGAELESYLQAQQIRVQKGLLPLGQSSLLPPSYEDISDKELVSRFGKGFVEELSLLELNQWSKPVKSAFGWHWLRVNKRQDSEQLSYDKVNKKVLNDWLYDAKRKQREQYEQQLKALYTVVRES
ncbi:peptidyl-prolyl cis-trans isomerase [Agaribacterium sp. ZY112]|uniref:peptidylprolyl isomerase n=1 Tax=Agaribacterium sp. ZY112 TaxID=3233574 RepID=UPI00352371C3